MNQQLVSLLFFIIHLDLEKKLWMNVNEKQQIPFPVCHEIQNKSLIFFPFVDLAVWERHEVQGGHVNSCHSCYYWRSINSFIFSINPPQTEISVY